MVPHAGMIPGRTLEAIARIILKDHGASKADITMAVRIVRGDRHRVGPWDQRPPYRLTPLLTGTVAKRRPQLLVGRRMEPSILQCVKALIHKVILEECLETGAAYAHTLTGMTFFGTRGLYAPPGVKPDAGPYKFQIYRLNYADFNVVGTCAKRACKAIGLDVSDSDLRAKIVTTYLQGQETGKYRHPIYAPPWSMRTTLVGDHPLDFRLPRKPWVAPHLRGKVCRSNGTVDRKPVDLGPMLPPPRLRSAIHRAQIKPKTVERNLRDPADTSWVFKPK
ncbi:MAG: hypothetical protein LC687_05770 [Actinobacteria bacterium]|nr:hypothetical protein [Actinomycetota bacterium]